MKGAKTMDDYIKREEAINAFDDPRVERYYGDVSPSSVIEVIETIPAADVVSEWVDIIYKHLDMEINYKKQLRDGSDTQQAFNCGYMVGLEFAKLVIKNNCCAGMRGKNDG